MGDWSPYYVDGSWVAPVVRRRQRELAGAELPWAPREIDLLSEPLPQSLVVEFEDVFGVVLPEDYRSFLLTVGDGGYGPGLGMRHLGRPLNDSVQWTPGTIETDPDLTSDTLLGQAFPYTDPAPSGSLEHPIGGLLYLFDFGDALWDVLVVTGPSRGQVWSDAMTDSVSIMPLELAPGTRSPTARYPGSAPIGSRLSFADYYGHWLSTGSPR